MNGVHPISVPRKESLESIPEEPELEDVELGDMPEPTGPVLRDVRTLPPTALEQNETLKKIFLTYAKARDRVLWCHCCTRYLGSPMLAGLGIFMICNGKSNSTLTFLGSVSLCLSPVCCFGNRLLRPPPPPMVQYMT